MGGKWGLFYSFSGLGFETNAFFRDSKGLIPICISTQLSNDEAMLGRQSWCAANLYRALPRTRGLDTKRNSIFRHGPVKRRSTVLWSVSNRITVQRIFVWWTCSWRESPFKHCCWQFGLRWERSYIRIHKRLSSIRKINAGNIIWSPLNCCSLDLSG